MGRAHRKSTIKLVDKNHRSRDKQLAVAISRLRQSIRDKHRSFKTGVIRSEEALEQKLKPISEPLKQLLSDSKSVRKKEEEEEEETPDDYWSGPLKGEKSVNESNVFLDEEEEEEVGDEKGEQSVLDQSSSSGHPLADEYFNLLVSGDAKKEIDNTYGVYHDTRNKQWMLGSKTISLDKSGGHILIGDKKYKESRGLYELIFKKQPDDKLYNKNDLNNYKTILTQTSAHKVGNIPSGTVKGNVGYKYKTIIRPLFEKRRSLSLSGSGLRSRKVRSNRYVYWDDANELCDRLRLLLASKDAGHTGHNNEIVSILEELREAKIIKGRARLFSLLSMSQ